VRTIGLLGGMSWESTAVYYRLLNEGAADRFGPLRQAPILLHSFDFAEVAARQRAQEWDQLGRRLSDATRGLVRAGAELIGICANTMHILADEVRRAADGVPLVHVVDATADAVDAAGARRVALLGTAYTMDKPFYADALRAHGLDVVLPGPSTRVELQRIIYEELTQGIVRTESRAALLGAIRECSDQGAQVAALACTEFQMLVEPGDTDSPVPVVDTTREHCRALLEAACE